MRGFHLGRIKSCGCDTPFILKPRNRLEDWTGVRFGMLVILARHGFTHTQSVWLCQCDCGNICTRGSHTLRKSKKSCCGCSLISNGLVNHPLYSVWHNIKRRCLNPDDPAYHRYGGRGITICDEWKYSFEAFYAYCLELYNPELSIDRIDNNGNYEPGNIRWADRQTQLANREISIKPI